MLAGPFPNEVPGIFRIDPHRAFAAADRCFEGACLRGFGSALPVSCRIGVISGRRRHKADAEHAAIGRIAETLNRLSIGSIGLGERPGYRRVEKRVSRVGLVHTGNHLDIIVGLHRFNRLRERNLAGRPRR